MLNDKKNQEDFDWSMFDDDCDTCGTEDIYQQIEKEEKEKDFPGLFQMSRNLAKDMFNAGKAKLKGDQVMASKELAEDRLKICQDCEFFFDRRCKHCGCFMDVKTHFETSECPIHKW